MMRAKRIVSIYLVLGTEHIESGQKKLNETFSRFMPQAPVLHVLVQNEKSVFESIYPGFDVCVPGDQNVFDFSGWDSAVGYLKKHSLLQEGDLVAFSNDSFFQTTGDKFLSYLTPDLYKDKNPNDFVFGYIDDFPKKARIGQLEYQSWIRTCLFFIPYTFLLKLGQLTVPLDRDIFFADSPQTFWSKSDVLSLTFKKYIGSWLFGWSDPEFSEYKLQWKKCAEPNAANFNFFKTKALAIISEHSLTARLRELDIPIVDYNLDPKLADRHTHPYYQQSIFR